MLIDLRRNKTTIPVTRIENNIIERVSSYKLLELWMDDNMKWNTNTEKVIKKAAKHLFLLKVLKSYGNWDGELFDIISQRLVSSTNLTVSSPAAKSLIMIKNKSGPSLVPCGTPAFINFHSEKN